MGRYGHKLDKTVHGYVWDEERLIPREDMTMLVGYDGTAKTTFILGLVAKMSQGLLSSTKEKVYIQAVEDSEVQTHARLLVAGADLSQESHALVFPKKDQVPWTFPRGLGEMVEYIQEEEITVAIFDSMDYHIEHIGSHRGRITLGEMRKVLCDELGITVIFVHHLNKSSGGSSRASIGGSRGILAAMRNRLIWGKRPVSFLEMAQVENAKRIALEEGIESDPMDILGGTHVLVVEKNSSGPSYPERESLLFKAKRVEHPFDPRESVLYFEKGPTTNRIGPMDVVKNPEGGVPKDENITKKEACKRAILSTLAGEGWIEGNELEDLICSEGDFSVKVFEAARAELAKANSIQRKDEGQGGDRKTFWQIVFNFPELTQEQ